jgi:hypothetical protein
MTASERAALHARAAAILAELGAAPEAVAVHLLHAEPRDDDAVAATLATAGRRALAGLLRRGREAVQGVDVGGVDRRPRRRRELLGEPARRFRRRAGP